MFEKGVILQHYLRTKFRFYPKQRELFEHWQEKRVQRHIRYVRKHSPFYQKLWESYSNEDWRNFPIIDKTIMMDQFDNLNTLGIEKDKAFLVAEQSEQSRDFSPMIGTTTVGLSSGTSGNRGLFLVSKHERRAWAGTIIAKTLPRSILRGEKIAFFLRANSNLYNSVGSKQLQFLFYDLLHPISEHIKRLNEQQPGIIVAPSSMLRILAEAQKNNKLHVKPHKVISVAEVLDPIDEQVIEEQFQQKVHQIYQCTEGFLANTCTYGTLHLNEDIVAIQRKYVDKQSRKFMPIITDFSRKAQPIVRYQLNDILTERATPCPCGSPMVALEAINGRTDDIFYFNSLHGKKLRPIFPDYISRCIINASPNITEYYVIQHAINRIEILLRLPEKVQSNDREKIEDRITKALCNICIQTECSLPVVQFNLLKRGIEHLYNVKGDVGDIKKLRRIERRCEVNEADYFI